MKAVPEALAVMRSFYASITGTSVLQQKEVPPRPSHYDGWIQVFGIAATFCEAAALEEERRLYGQASVAGTRWSSYAEAYLWAENHYAVSGVSTSSCAGGVSSRAT